MTPRDRLAALAAAAGYPGRLLAEIADATLPGFRPGQLLTDPEIGQLALAVDLLAHAGHHADSAAALIIARHRDLDPSVPWRTSLWRDVLQTARARHEALERGEPSGGPAHAQRRAPAGATRSPHPTPQGESR